MDRFLILTLTVFLSAFWLSAIVLADSNVDLYKFCVPPGNGQIPAIKWQERSDWINVRKDIKPAAIGDGVSDDTEALQVALDAIGDSPGGANVIYLPPGTYRISRTLVIEKKHSGMIVGHGRDTRIVWAGENNQRMFWSNGFPRATYRGIVWDGAGKASVGIDHDSKSLYETRIMHEDMEFRNFRLAGIRIGHDQNLATAEVMYRNLKFVNNRNGVLLQSWNNYNNVFDGVHFIDNEFGIRAEKGNVTVRNSRFEHSGNSDLYLSTHSHSVRRVVSIGSNKFIETVRGLTANGLIRIENSRISSWKNHDGAIVTSLRGPVFIFDVTFSDSPNNKPPIKMSNPAWMNQIVIMANVKSDTTDQLLTRNSNSIVYDLSKHRNVEPLVSLGDVFLRDKVEQPERILDVVQDCGASGDGIRDDTDAIQGCINRAAKIRESVEVYFPSGTYKITDVISTAPGSAYSMMGTGWHSRLVYKGRRSRTLFEINDPDGIKIRSLAFGGKDGVTTIHQTGNNRSAAYYHNVFAYYNGEVYDQKIMLDSLPSGSLVVMDHIDGRMHVHDSSQAIILIGFLVSVQMMIDGDAPQTGYLGLLGRVSALEEYPLIIRDNQSLVMADWYNEQTSHLMYLSGSAKRIGHVIIDHTQATTDTTLNTTIDGYNGLVSSIGGMFGDAYDDKPRKTVVADGDNLDLMVGGSIFWNKSPVISTGVKNTVFFGNSISRRTFSPVSVVKDSGTTHIDTVLQVVLEELRRLGEYDLKINYCH